MNRELSGLSRFECYPRLRFGLGRRAEAWARDLVTAAWSLSLGRTYEEDLRGAVDSPELQQSLKLCFVELLVLVDLHLAGQSALGEEHLLPCALQLGFSEVVGWTGTQVQAELRLGESLGTQDIDLEGLRGLWDACISQFIGTVPDPVSQANQVCIVGALRNWSRVCELAGQDPSFMAAYLRGA